MSTVALLDASRAKFRGSSAVESPWIDPGSSDIDPSDDPGESIVPAEQFDLIGFANIDMGCAGRYERLNGTDFFMHVINGSITSPMPDANVSWFWHDDLPDYGSAWRVTVSNGGSEPVASNYIAYLPWKFPPHFPPMNEPNTDWFIWDGTSLSQTFPMTIEKIPSCLIGKRRVGDTCVANSCVCSNGEPFPMGNLHCIVSGADTCESCIRGYTLVQPHCVANICVCDNGAPQLPGSPFCIEDGGTACSSCDTDHYLSGSSCLKNSSSSALFSSDSLWALGVAAAVVVLLLLCCYLRARKKRRRREEILRSQDAGVSAAWLIREFPDVARRATGLENPTFHDLKGPLFTDVASPHQVGREQMCPRDGQRGCALVDTLAPQWRGEATHFLSWVWQYDLDTFTGALETWLCRENLRPEDVYLYVCFMCNNQYRILVEQSAQGVDGLESEFEPRLRKIGHMVAMLDTWNSPRYLTRVWPIFEQFTANKLGIVIDMILPFDQQRTFEDKLQDGRIKEVANALRNNVDVKAAKASVQHDEDRVKSLIENSLGFEAVNVSVRNALFRWCESSFANYLRRTHPSSVGMGTLGTIHSLGTSDDSRGLMVSARPSVGTLDTIH